MGHRSGGAVTRRAFLTAVAGGTGAAATVGGATQEGDSGTVTVDMTDELVFDPDEATVAPGTTVVWENVGEVGHSVTAYEEEIPEDAAFFASGGLASESAAREAYPQQGDVVGGESYSHTFEVEGTYEYFCIPHEPVGMVASLTVTSDPPEADGGVDIPDVPAAALALGVGVGTAFLLVASLAFFFLKYGGDYGGE